MCLFQHVGGGSMKNACVVIALVTEVLLINRRANEGSEFPLPADVLIFLSLRRRPAAELLIDPQIRRSIPGMAAVGGNTALLLVLLAGWGRSLAFNWNPLPRKTVRYHGK